MSEDLIGDNACFLVAVTPQARAAIGDGRIEIRSFPFRVGRESRSGQKGAGLTSVERRQATVGPRTNDLYLLEPKGRHHVSREHFQIEREGAGFTLVDRESTCGTLVEGSRIGGRNRGGKASLSPGDVIIVGTASSPFVFKFAVR